MDNPHPLTVTEAVVFLHEQGYTDEIELNGPKFVCARNNLSYDLANVIVDHTFRFEGDSDPGDEAIVLGLRYPDSDIRATLVSAYGREADPATAAFFRRLRQ
ncbi:MAG: phosphoribosylpyrophosphate synthetase [Ilumatobacteraceae bacterium]